MMNLGLSDVEVGNLSSLGLFLQIFTALFGGVVIDRLGRNRATLIFDLLSWSLPCLLWGMAQGVGLLQWQRFLRLLRRFPPIPL
jgi:MFS family permease